MSRELTAAMLAAIAAGTVRPAFLYQGEFDGGTVRLWTGLGTLSWDGQSWTGMGELLAINPIEEATDVRAVGVSVSLSGESSALRSANLGAARQGLPGYLWLACFDASGAMSGDPALCFAGRLDRPELVEDGSRCTISVNYESRLADLDRVRIRRWTHEDQQLEHPGDLGFQYVASMQDAKLPWGGALGDYAMVAAFNASVRNARG